VTSTDAAGRAGEDGSAVDQDASRPQSWSLPVPLAISVSLLGGACSAAQALVNGRLGDSVGSPVTAALVSNGLATVVLAAALSLTAVRTGLRRVAAARLPWWTYLGGALGALTVAGTALAAPVLGVALFTVVQVSGASVAGVVTDRIGLGPMGQVPVTAIRLVSALVAVVAVTVAQFGRPIGHLAIGTLLFVLFLGLCRPAQVALNGRITAAASNVGSASLVNAVIGTGTLVVTLVAFDLTGHLRFGGWPSGWWLYLGGFLALIVTGSNMVSVQSIGVLRTGLTALGGQITGGLIIDAVIPAGQRPTLWLYLGASLTIAAALAAGAGRQTAVRRSPPVPEPVD
jgi:bacterial/archaeal transporter family-2 protein